jgi:hypothetical protein
MEFHLKLQYYTFDKILFTKHDLIYVLFEDFVKTIFRTIGFTSIALNYIIRGLKLNVC